MGYKKPEKKSRLKDLEDLLEALPDRFKEPKLGIPSDIEDRLKKFLQKKEPKKEIPDWVKEFLEKNRPDLRKIKPFPKPDSEFLTEPPEGMVPNPIMTMEFRDANQNGIEDREEGIFLPRDFVPEDSLPKGPKPVPFPKMRPDPDRIKPVPFPKMRPDTDPRFLWPPEGWKRDPRFKPKPDPRFLWPPEGWKRDPRYRPRPMPDGFLWPPEGREPQPFKPPIFDPEKGPDPRYLLESSAPHPMEGYDDLLEKSALEVFGKKLKDLTNDEYEELEYRIRAMDMDIPAAAKGGIMDIDRMTAPLGYDTGGPVPRHRQKKEMTIDSIISDAEASRGPGEQGIISKAIYKLAGDPVIDPIWKAKQFIKEKILRRTPGDQGSASGMHPLVEFKEMYDQYIIDGGDMSFKEFFDMIQIELDKMAGE